MARRSALERPASGRTRTPRDVENSKNEARAGYRRSVEPITPLVKAPRVAVRYRGKMKNVHLRRDLPPQARHEIEMQPRSLRRGSPRSRSSRPARDLRAGRTARRG